MTLILQAVAIEQFVMQYANERIILPEICNSKRVVFSVSNGVTIHRGTVIAYGIRRMVLGT
jgi:hypothetical protein